MGVHGLWRLIEPSGKPVPLESLENKVLAVDLSIWLHQAIKGFQDARGGSVPNAHLLGIYHKVCKLLYYRIKPVFVFDGGVPVLKKQTIAKRNQLKSQHRNASKTIQQKLIETLLKQAAVSKVLSETTRSQLEQTATDGSQSILTKEKPRTSDKRGMFELPPSQFDCADSSSSDTEAECTSEANTTTSNDCSPSKYLDLHNIDVKSQAFRNLTAETRHEILTELKETRKQNSWGRLHELPTQSDDFSSFQMKRLLNRYSVQVGLDEATADMGGQSLSMAELEALMNDNGVIKTRDIGNRIASNDTQKVLYVKSLKRALDGDQTSETVEKAARIGEDSADIADSGHNIPTGSNSSSCSMSEDDIALRQAIELSLKDVPTASICDVNEEIHNVESSSSKLSKTLLSARSYMAEYSGLTPNEINKIIYKNSKSLNDSQKAKSKSSVSIATSSVTTSPSNKSRDDEDGDLARAIALSLQDVADPLEPVSLQSSQDDGMDMRTIINHGDCNEQQSNKLITLVHFGESTSDKCVENDDNESSTSSDSAFEEVRETLLDTADNNQITPTTEPHEDMSKSPIKNKFEIMIDSDIKLNPDDDLFGDIFEGVVCNEQQDNEASSSVKITEEAEDLMKTINVSNAFSFRNKDEVTEEDINVVPLVINGETIDNVTTEKMEQIKELLSEEANDLIRERGTEERLASNISSQMYAEVQQMLRLFGVPYIVAPMEAESQCAFLEMVGLTNGSITDDSDIWLFGGQTVYKNFFDHTKHVMEFRSKNIEQIFKLNREQLILLAMLVGSDYTTGLSGVGPVTALEILAAFPVSNSAPSKLNDQRRLLTGLKRFRDWLVDRSIKDRVTLRAKLKNCVVTHNFPSAHIIEAYLDPVVDKSEEKFSWSRPDIVALTDFAQLKLGWTKAKTESILGPVLKRCMDKKSQKTMRDYYKSTFNCPTPSRTDVVEKMSMRVKKAISKIDQKESSGDEMDEEIELFKRTKKTSRKHVTSLHKKIEAEIKAVEEADASNSSRPKLDFKSRIHRIERIPQKEKTETNILKSKKAAIELFKKGKSSGARKAKTVVNHNVRQEAMLSESSSD